MALSSTLLAEANGQKGPWLTAVGHFSITSEWCTTASIIDGRKEGRLDEWMGR